MAIDTCNESCSSEKGVCDVVDNIGLIVKQGLKSIDFNCRPELQTYKEDLKIAASEGSDILFSNGGPEHAAILLSTIFDNAKHEIYIFGSTLRAELTSYREYYEALLRSIERGVCVKVLLDEQDEESKSPVRKWLEDKSRVGSDNVSVRSCRNLLKVMTEQLPYAAHFTVADGRMFRLEYDRTNFKAFGSFNNSEVSRILKIAFEETFEKCQ